MYKLSIFFIFISQTLFAQEHLEPANGYFSSYKFQNKYYPLVRKYLLDDFKNSPLARVTILPSFLPEYVVSVDSSKKEYFIICRIFNKQIWSNQDNKNFESEVQKIEFKVKIEVELATLLNKLFFELTSQTRFPKFEYIEFNGGKRRVPSRIGTDGTTYIFSVFQNGFGTRSGQTWSPNKNTLMAELIGIAELMVLVAKQQETENELYSKSEKLYNKIKNE
ncbi:hypothetical protein [Emticicia sp.]|uniref:hypothetical protein n=1 Tax=Emticicia sp. TaxID=1930953 RepID=UPI003753D4A7